MHFEWDDEKAASNLLKHDVSFVEAKTVFGDPLATTVADQEHSVEEQRWITTGMSQQQRVIVVWHTNRGAVIRMIGARPATPQERRIYESGD